VQDGSLDSGDGLVQTVGHFLVGDGCLHRMCRHEVRSSYDERLRLVRNVRKYCSYGFLDVLGRSLSDSDVMLLSQICLDVACENITGDTDTVLDYDTSERNDCDFSGTASYVDNHVSPRCLHVETDTEGCCHRLRNQIHVTSSSMFRRVADRTDLHFGTS